MKELWIGDLATRENQTIVGFFVAANRQERTTAGGAAYLSLTLCDSTGQMEARVWEPKDASDFRSGDVVKLRGTVCRYQEKLQVKVEKLRRAESSEYEFGDFVPTTPFDIGELWGRLTGYVASFTDDHLRALLELFLDDPVVAEAWKQAPAAKSLHHAWIGGLLEHTVSLLDLCERTASHYPEVHRDLLLAGAMLHDIGKLHELRWGTSFGYTTEGQLLGHITIGVGMIQAKIASLSEFPPRLAALLLHIVLSHHGRLEFGSPKLPMTAEAIIFSYLDDLDAKMHMLRSEFARAAANGTPVGEPTDWVRAMERPLLDSRAYLTGS